MPRERKEGRELEEEIQRKYIKFQVLKQQLNAMVEEKVLLDSKTNELMVTASALKKLPEVKDGQEIWSTLGSGAFVKADIKDTESVMVEIGAGVYIRKKLEEALKILQTRLNEMEKLNDDLLSEINKFSQQISRLEPELERLIQESR